MAMVSMRRLAGLLGGLFGLRQRSGLSLRVRDRGRGFFHYRPSFTVRLPDPARAHAPAQWQPGVMAKLVAAAEPARGAPIAPEMLDALSKRESA